MASSGVRKKIKTAFFPVLNLEMIFGVATTSAMQPIFPHFMKGAWPISALSILRPSPVGNKTPKGTTMRNTSFLPSLERRKITFRL